MAAVFEAAGALIGGDAVINTLRSGINDPAAVPGGHTLAWPIDFDPGTKMVDVYIRYLRQKIDEPGEASLIQTARGFGYKLKGPGVDDMKGGIVVMLNALRAVKAQGLLDDANITVVFNSDEEIGSRGSRDLIMSLAKEHDIGLIFESSPPGEMTRSRKGLGQARLKVTGREAHAGANHEEGVSANLELAHKIIEIEKLTGYDTGSTVNTGTMRAAKSAIPFRVAPMPISTCDTSRPKRVRN